MNVVVVVLLLMAVLTVFSVPIGIAIGVGSAFHLYARGLPLMTIPQKMFTTVDNFTLLAIPLFLFAGRIMNSAGITRRLFNFANVLVGHVKGGLGHVNVLASIIFAGMSGSATADTVGLGTIEIAAMKEAGFDVDFAASITLASSTIGPIIPPSIIMVIYGVVSGASIGRLFIAGIVPGFMMGVMLSVMVYFISSRRNYPVRPFPGLKAAFSALVQALPVLLTPVIIIGGIYLGIFTPTEAAVVAVVYALILGFAYKELTLAILWEDLKQCAVDVGVLMLIIGITGAFGWWITIERIPQVITEAISAVTQNRIVVLLLVNAIILILGCFLDATPIVLIMVPILLPLLNHLHINLVYFGILISVNTMIGLTTPPVGICLYGVAGVSRLPIERIVRAYLPFFFMLVLVLVILILFPQLVMWLPNLLMGPEL